LDYFRFYEYPTFYRSLDLRPGLKVLDLGCGRGLCPLFCAFHNPDVEYTTVDIDATAVEWQQRMALRLGGLPNFHPSVGDSTQLEFPDASFDRVGNLGSIEHIPEEGDLATSREMGRVCAKDGILVYSIPYSFEGCEQATTDHWEGFERRYDDRTLEERLIHPSGRKVDSLVYFGEPGFPFSRYWYPLPFVLKAPLRHLAPPASFLWLKGMPPEDRARACGVRVVLR
jgi:SAM-dependent methyltransferase